jgi:hypothetical protein
MERLFGLMPNSEVEIEKTYVDDLGLKIIIQAGPNGYSIIYADHSAEWGDYVDSTENNLKRAVDKLNGIFIPGIIPTYTELNEDLECCEECIKEAD